MRILKTGHNEQCPLPSRRTRLHFTIDRSSCTSCSSEALRLYSLSCDTLRYTCTPARLTTIHKCGFFWSCGREGLADSEILLLRRGEVDALLDLVCLRVR